MTYLLDTDVMIDFLKKKDPGFSVVVGLFGKKTATSVIAWSEVMYGIKKSTAYEKKLSQFNELLSLLSASILSVTTVEIEKYINLKIKLEKEKNPLASFDIIIAATAISHNMTLVTRNIKHFERIKELKLYK